MRFFFWVFSSANVNPLIRFPRCCHHSALCLPSIPSCPDSAVAHCSTGGNQLLCALASFLAAPGKKPQTNWPEWRSSRGGRVRAPATMGKPTICMGFEVRMASTSRPLVAMALARGLLLTLFSPSPSLSPLLKGVGEQDRRGDRDVGRGYLGQPQAYLHHPARNWVHAEGDCPAPPAGHRAARAGVPQGS